ncbi:Na+/H+ antiporter NhaA [Herbidospora cretacea]|uniref:Na+/H+ antiporter NhaA n=1 Tax=Herbidospora cretacea TaxID=28444 RepID=UPI0022AF2E2D|nr:Na+/H+ antiporter NhaA [Herbidospora cretacea]
MGVRRAAGDLLLRRRQELKEELVHGELSRFRDAILPVVSAVAGMAVPALIDVGVSWGCRTPHGGGRFRRRPTSRSCWPCWP